MPWYVQHRTNRLDAKTYLNAIGLGADREETKISTRIAKLRGISESEVLILKDTGFDEYSSLMEMSDIKIWSDPESKSNDRVVVTGFAERDGRRAGVIQVFTFSASEVKNPEDGSIFDFKVPIENFVKSLKDAKLPLILDLRNNDGGNPLRGQAIMAAIARTGASYTPANTGYRLTARNRQMIELWDNGDVFDPDNWNEDAYALHFLRKANAEGARSTELYPDASKITPSELVGGYDEAVVALISPECVSTCDLLAMLLKHSGRAKLLGTHANGTGAGFSTTRLFPDPWFQDPFKVIRLHVPNMLFAPPSIGVSAENIPTQADVQYKSDLKDFLNQSDGWKKAAFDLLEAK